MSSSNLPAPILLPTKSSELHESILDDDEEMNMLENEDQATAEGFLKEAFLRNMNLAARERALSLENMEGSSSLSSSDSPEKKKRKAASAAENLFQDIPEPYLNDSIDYQRIHISNCASPQCMDSETKSVLASLRRCLELRKKWMAVNDNSIQTEEQANMYQCPAIGEHFPANNNAQAPTSPRSAGINRRRRRNAILFDPFSVEIPAATDEVFEMIDGVMHVFERDPLSGVKQTTPQYQALTLTDFYTDYFELKKILHFGPVKTLAFKRLRLLDARFNLHVLLNGERELLAQKSVPHRDFYNIRKVDTHVHHSACMNQKHLLRFIKSKLKQTPDEIVIFRDGRFMTLSEVFQSLHLTAYDLSVDTLDMHASNTFHRFDRFNLKYNPAGQSRLREIFLKTDNLIAGRYLADITKEVMEDLKSSKYQLAEWRVSIYGRKLSEWDKLARWFYVNRLSSNHIRWMIQIPRLYYIYKRSGDVENFQDMIDNMFAPLFHVTRDPSSNPPLFYFLQTVVGFDCVDDESKVESYRSENARDLPTPGAWTANENPPYDYWCYYIYANLSTLNSFRRSRGMSTFSFRPHSGEAGDPDHLAAAYLTANGINHGITLRKSVALQYLYYLSQVGIAMSPLSNNKLFLDYHRNPFPVYHARGLNVSLSSDDPLLLHYTKDALVEEYSVAAQVWKLSSIDVCEVARYSVLQSGFEHPFKAHFLGGQYYKAGAAGNDIRMSNVPDIRVNYRKETLENELAFVQSAIDS